MLRILTLLILIVTVFGAQQECNQQHTLVYDEWKRGAFTGDFFVRETYLPNTVDSALDCDFYSTKAYRQYVKANIPCTGNWCRNDEFACLGGYRDRECYHVEHIVDRRNSIGQNDDPAKDIGANYIMAYSRWNMELGKLCWEDVQAEKAEIYGEIFNQAKQAVTECMGIELSQPYKISLETWLDGGAVVILGLLALLFMAFLIYGRRCSNPDVQVNTVSLTNPELDEIEVTSEQD